MLQHLNRVIKLVKSLTGLRNWLQAIIDQVWMTRYTTSLLYEVRFNIAHLHRMPKHMPF